jgi:hypothetical protein
MTVAELVSRFSIVKLVLAAILNCLNWRLGFNLHADCRKAFIGLYTKFREGGYKLVCKFWSIFYYQDRPASLEVTGKCRILRWRLPPWISKLVAVDPILFWRLWIGICWRNFMHSRELLREYKRFSVSKEVAAAILNFEIWRLFDPSFPKRLIDWFLIYFDLIADFRY